VTDPVEAVEAELLALHQDFWHISRLKNSPEVAFLPFS